MKRDTSLFSDDFKVEISNQVIDYDTSHIYTGHIYGKYTTENGWKCSNFKQELSNSMWRKLVSVLLDYC